MRAALFGNSLASYSLTLFAVCRSFSNLVVNTDEERRLDVYCVAPAYTFPVVPCIILSTQIKSGHFKSVAGDFLAFCSRRDCARGDFGIILRTLVLILLL